MLDALAATAFAGPPLALLGVGGSCGFLERLPRGGGRREVACLIAVMLMVYHFVFHALANLDLRNAFHLAGERHHLCRLGLVTG